MHIRNQLPVPRQVAIGAATMIVWLVIGTGMAAAASGAIMQTSINDLAIIEMFARLHELLRNFAYLLGPILLLHGLTLWAIGGNGRLSQEGYRLLYGGSILFGLSLALDVILQLVVWIASGGNVAT